MTGVPPGSEREEPIPITPDMLDPGSPETRVDFERGMRAFPPLTLSVIAVLTAVFLWEVSTGALRDESSILAAGALARAPVAAGEVWRLFTAPFLHGGVGHLLGNCIVLYIVGMAYEHAVGPARLGVAYTVSGLAGSGLSVAANAGPSVGASGAIFGVAGAVIVVLYRHRDRWHLRDRRIGLVLLVWAGYQVATGFLTPYVDNSAHIGGLVGGAATALGLRPRVRA